jgi:hypothetical protein
MHSGESMYSLLRVKMIRMDSMNMFIPNETIEFLGKPGFHCLHNIIYHTTWVDVLDCWRIEVKGCGFGSHVVFTNSKPL